MMDIIVLFLRGMFCFIILKDLRKVLDLCLRDFLVGFIEYYEFFGMFVCSINEFNLVGVDVGEFVKKLYFICEER